MRRAQALTWLLLGLFLAAQLAFAQAARPLRPRIEEMPTPPSPLALKVLAFGDDQFLVRALDRWLQDVGDGGGRVRPLREYDYDRVVGWLKAADSLDAQSQYPYELATHYFGALSDPATAPQKVKTIVEYCRDAALADPPRRWEWLVWAAVKAQALVKDRPLAHQLAIDLAAMRDRAGVPPWLPLLAIPLYRFSGDLAAAQSLEADPGLADLRRRAVDDLVNRRDLSNQLDNRSP
jgi:hypothetical protein